jgi:hypothetical protein
VPASAHRWYSGLRSPGGVLCCNECDCRPVAARVDPRTRREEIWANGAWYPIEYEGASLLLARRRLSRLLGLRDGKTCIPLHRSSRHGLSRPLGGVYKASHECPMPAPLRDGEGVHHPIAASPVAQLGLEVGQGSRPRLPRNSLGGPCRMALEQGLFPLGVPTPNT